MARNEIRYSAVRCLRRFFPAVVLLLSCTILAPTLRCQSAAEKAPFNPAAFDIWASTFVPGSSAVSPSSQCPSSSAQSCAEGFSTVGGGGLGFQYRPLRYLETGVDFHILGDSGAFGPQIAGSQCVVYGCSGNVIQNVSVLESMIVTSARAVLPLFREHLLISGGGGLALLFANLNPVGNEQFSGCYACRSRSGHGPMEMGEVVYFPDQRRRLGIGFRVAPVQVRTSSLSAATAGANPDQIFKDHFVLISVGASLRFGGRKTNRP